MRLSLVCAMTLLCVTPILAKADTFSVTGNGQSITFSLPDSVVPSMSDPTSGFIVGGVAVDVNGTVLTTDIGFGIDQFPDLFIGDGASVAFNSTNSGLPYYIYAFGPQLFSGSVIDPTFTIGDFTVDNDVDLTFFGGLTTGDFALSIANDASVTPEPSSLLLLGTGALGMFGVCRRKWASL